VEIEDYFFIGEFVLGDFHWMGVLGVVALKAAKGFKTAEGICPPFESRSGG